MRTFRPLPNAAVPSPAEQKLEAAMCSADAAYFTSAYGQIDNKDGDGNFKGVTSFDLWPAQLPVMSTLVTMREVLILKPRQVGISWLVCAYVLWKCVHEEMQTALLLSKDKDSAQELIDRIKKLYRRLPDWLRNLLPRLTVNNMGDLGWENGSRVMSLAATQGAGRSFTADVVVMDEVDYMTWGAEVYASVRPAMESSGGQIILLTTGNGVGSLMHSLWSQSKQGLNDFVRVFLPWWARPGRDAAWYEKALRSSNDKGKFKEDYPANDVEAFASTGSGRFEPEWLDNQAPNTMSAPIPREKWPNSLDWRPGWDGCPVDLPALRQVPGLTVYKAPEAGHRYMVAADVAEGKVDGSGDYDSAVVLDQDTLEEVADLHGQWEPKDFALYLMALSEPYRATVMPERNNHGHAVIATMRVHSFPRIGLGHDGSWGWVTSVKSKPEGVDLLAEYLKDNVVTVRTPATVSELQTFVRKPGGKLEARQGFHDDRVMKWVVGLSAIRAGTLNVVKRTLTRGRNPLAGYRG